MYNPISRIFNYFDKENERLDKINAEYISNIKGKVNFKDMFFSYNGVKNGLKRISFQVKSREMPAIVVSSRAQKIKLTRSLSNGYNTLFVN